MLGSKLISKTFNFAKSSITSSYNFLMDYPTWQRRTIGNIKNYFIDFKFRLSNLSEANLELGIHHLHQNNLNDAWIRFKLIDKFLSPNDKIANYWLGWTYYLKNNIPKAIFHLERAHNEDMIGLLPFLRNIDQAKETPQEIWTEQRDITAEYYAMNFYSSNIHLPLTFTDILKNHITYLPDSYTIVELGSNIGILGIEIVKRLPDKIIHYIGVENSPIMNELVKIYFPQQKIYDQLISVSIPEFLAEQQDKYDLILSFDGLSFAQHLEHYFKMIYNMLSENGYFAFALRVGIYENFSVKHKQFHYTQSKLLIELKKIGFTILHQEEFLLEINNKYIIVMTKKSESKSIT